MDEVTRLKRRLFALNRKIRACPGTKPTPEWRRLMDEHRALEYAIFTAHRLAQPAKEAQDGQG